MTSEPEATIEITSGVSAFDGSPFCAVFMNGVGYGQLTPDEVRAMAMEWLEAAEAATTDAAVFAELQSSGLSVEAAGAFITGLRKRRGDTTSPTA